MSDVEPLVAELCDDLDKLGTRLVRWGERWVAYAVQLGENATPEQFARMDAAHERFRERLNAFIAGMEGDDEN